VKIFRFILEVYFAKNICYLKVTLPKADSKLDKERETKKDFKEKIAMMSIFYKAIHKLTKAGLRDTIFNFIFPYTKISLELVYKEGEVNFFISTYKSYAGLISQHITSTYTDAEVKPVEFKDYIDLKPKGFSLHAASLGKEHDNVYPIKIYKYLEDDPLNNFTNVFGELGRDDRAIFQVVVKPASSRWNKKAKKAAGLVSKGKYGKMKKIPFLDIFWNPIVAMIEGPEDMVGKNNAP